MSSIDKYKNTVPLSKIAKAAIIDSFGDFGKDYELMMFWAARGLKKLSNETLKFGKRYVLLRVNRNTRTATLPPDFSEDKDHFVGIINEHGQKVELVRNGNIALHYKHIDIQDGVDVCEKCKQKKSVCEDLQITEEVSFIVIDGTTYEESVIKKMYPNGDYFIETDTPVKHLENGTVGRYKTKKFVTNFDLKECGCLEDTEENLCKLQTNCPEVYCNYFARSACSTNEDYGGYRIFEETGLIQFDKFFHYDWVYLEYMGYMPKINGQYHVPEVAFETLVKWVQFMSIDGKRNVPNNEKQWRFKRYLDERGNMEKILGRVSLSVIINAACSIPNFDINTGRNWRDCYCENKQRQIHRPIHASVNTVVEKTNTVVRITEDRAIVYEKIQFEVGNEDDTPNMVQGETEFVINKVGIKQNSVNVVLGTQTLNEGVTDEISYTVVYESSRAVITFNQGVNNGQRYAITYTRTA